MKVQQEHNKEQKPVVLQAKQEPGTGDAATITDNRSSTVHQRKLRETMNASAAGKAAPVQRKKNNTGLPDQLKSGIENLSGYAMDDVKVHYNSSKPAQLQAHAYAQGTDIHLAPGQEKHLPHEAWHVVQQKQGRVKPTKQLKSKININDDAGLEKEADVMGEKAMQRWKVSGERNLQRVGTKETTVQRTIEDDLLEYELRQIRDGGIWMFETNVGTFIKGQTLSGMKILSSGNNKTAVIIDDPLHDWLLVYAMNQGQQGLTDLNAEVTLMQNIEQAGARIPPMFRPPWAQNLVFPIPMSIIPIKEDEEGYKPTELPYDRISHMRHVVAESQRILSLNMPADAHDAHYAFVQKRIRGAELGKAEDRFATFSRSICYASEENMQNTYTDLVNIYSAFERNPWGDFQLLYEKSTGYVYVFDPAPIAQVGNNFDPLQVLDDLMKDLQRHIAIEGY